MTQYNSVQTVTPSEACRRWHLRLYVIGSPADAGYSPSGLATSLEEV